MSEKTYYDYTNWYRYPLRNTLRDHFMLEICITDVCNLSCRFCCHATPENQHKFHMPIEEIQRIATEIKPYEFFGLKLSGGEPTLHPNFEEICRSMRSWFPVHHYTMASNGKRLMRYKHLIDLFDSIEVTRYPGTNDKEFAEIEQAGFDPARVMLITRTEGENMRDVFEKPNLQETDVFAKCRYPAWKKVVAGRLYPCSNVFGQAIRGKDALNEVSVPIDKDWRSNLANLDIEEHCRNCWVKVSDNPENCRIL